jgi:hypothetical protein
MIKTFYVYSTDFTGSRAVQATDINEAYKEAKYTFGKNVSVERA